MASSEWWWEMQGRVPEGATVVPLLFATDKTQLTYHSGDQTIWPIYLTIGNLSHEARRSKKLNGFVMVGMLPIIRHQVSRDIRARTYHRAMGILLERKYF
jgi:hypothetical protein